MSAMAMAMAYEWSNNCNIFQLTVSLSCVVGTMMV